MKSWSSIKFHTLLLGQNKNSLMFVRRFSGVAWIHFKGKFQKKKPPISSWKTTEFLQETKNGLWGPLDTDSPFCQQNGYKTGGKSPASFRLFRGLSEFKTKLFPFIKAPQFFNDFLQIGIQWHKDDFQKEVGRNNFLVTLHDLLVPITLASSHIPRKSVLYLKKRATSGEQNANLGRTKKSPPQRW